MLQKVREHNAVRSAPHSARTWDGSWDLDDAHRAVWDAVRHLFPAHAMVDQVDHGCLLVAWSLRDGRRNCSQFAAPVLIRIDSGLLLALWTSGATQRADIAGLQAETVREALAGYDPHSRIPTAGVIRLGD